MFSVNKKTDLLKNYVVLPLIQFIHNYLMYFIFTSWDESDEILHKKDTHDTHP